MLPIAMALLQFAPTLAGLFGGPKAEDVAAHVVGIAKTVTGQSAPEAALAAIQADPNLSMQFQKAVLEQQGKMAEIAADVTKAELAADTADTQAVNTTMQTEAKADHWPTYAWRPFIGFCFGIAWLGVYLILPILKGFWPDIPLPQISSEAWLSIGGILGVASWFRGKAQADPRIPTDGRG